MGVIPRRPAQFETGLDIVAITRIVAGIDQLEVLSGAHRQPKPLDAGLDHLRTADEDRFGDPFLDDGLDRAQHPFILAFGIDHALRARFGGLHHGLHDEAGAEHKARQCLFIEGKIGDRLFRDTRVHRGLCDRRGDAQDQARIEGRRNETVLAILPRLAAIGPGDHVGRRFMGELRRSRAPRQASSPR